MKSIKDLLDFSLILLIGLWAVLCTLEFVKVEPKPVEIFTFLTLFYLLKENIRNSK